jgi:hypothetical protein
LFNPKGDPFLSTLAAASPERLEAAAGGEHRGEDHLPFLEIFQNAKLMSSPAQVALTLYYFVNLLPCICTLS